MSKHVEIPVVPLLHNEDPKCSTSDGHCPFLCVVPRAGPLNLFCSAFTHDNGEFESINRVNLDGAPGLEPHLSCPVHYETERDAMRRKIESEENQGGE